MQIDAICLKGGIIPSLNLEYSSSSKKLFIIQAVRGNCNTLPHYTASKVTFAQHLNCILNRALNIHSGNEASVYNEAWGDCSRQKTFGLSNRNVLYQHNR